MDYKSQGCDGSGHPSNLGYLGNLEYLDSDLDPCVKYTDRASGYPDFRYLYKYYTT